MNAPLKSFLDREILNDLFAWPENATAERLSRLRSLAREVVSMDYVATASVPAGQTVTKVLKMEPGFNFVSTGASVQHDQPENAPLVQLTDLKKQRQIYGEKGIPSSAAFGPGACAVLTEPAFILWDFGEMGIVEISFTNTAATTAEITAILTGWKWSI